MTIKKRNGQLVEFDMTKIERAVGLSIGETDESIQHGKYQSLLESIETKLYDEIDVEKVQDIVINALLDYDLYESAKRYIIYREERNKHRTKVKSVGLLSDEFISKYKHSQSPMTQLGELVYYRTYSRFLPEFGRREYWWETVRRAVEYNCSLIKTSVDEAESLYDAVFNLKVFLSGRTFWVGGTDVSKKYPMANYNCSFQIIDDFEAFRDVFYLLMIGSGAGIRVLKSDVAKLPRIRTNLEVVHKYIDPIHKFMRQDNTSLIFDATDTVEIVVGDSKDGWVQALDHYFKLQYSREYNGVNRIIINYNNVRPKGEPLKTFGGTASGHESLMNMFFKIDKVLKKYKDTPLYKLQPIDCADICNIIGENVVVGGVRRTSEVVLCDYDDTAVINAKSELYTKVDDVWEVNEDLLHRQMSNNSVFYKSKPTKEVLHKHILAIRYSGEPAFVNEESAKKRRPNFNGVNPCVEILLNNRGLCNLVTLNLMKFVVNGRLQLSELKQCQTLSARASYRMTNVELELPKWDAVQKEERLTGCSLTGWQDMVNACNLDRSSQISVLQLLRSVAHESTEYLASTIGANKPLLVTTIKPEGTISQLPTVSSGLHYSHSPYYIRRVRITANDPLVKVCEELGYPVLPEVGQDWSTCSTKVIEFPVKSPEGRTKYDVSAIEQLENYKMFMNHYVDHNASITVHVRNDEWDAVEEWVYNNWDDVVAVSFLSLDDAFYKLMPYEAITEDEYNSRFQKVQGKTITPSRIAKFEDLSQQFTLDESCDTGACPVR